ncbi:MAG TPA: tRNA (adenosine(37)-N6)-threonylcarbamoyltransferase complex dimerization subunit type 1 TsaB [Oligoflexia bacterium]|nr:tRNA (adenosine(37)-N6)-threonylcarbamoyltransferase complex dimerization subunit type 1 TsaB [Oligoflexia bacterium]HMR24958.1 tRNA (adenosine(37)-N6)-threonylcarbamoyltransferase complex dimerization subunit type 1 TsaB [Oligoflexia bacterium]
MLHLILDSSQPYTHWVLAKNQAVLGEIKSEQRFDTAEQTLILLQNLLKKHALDLTDITSYAYIAGPGSFTGLRIGAATLKALSFSNHQQNIVALDPCYLLAQQYVLNQAEKQDCLLVPVIASRKNHFYHCTYDYTQKNLALKQAVCEQAMTELNNDYFMEAKNKPIIFLGPDCTLLNEQPFFQQHDNTNMTAQTLAYFAYQEIMANNFVDKASFGPNYIVQSVAKPKHNR